MKIHENIKHEIPINNEQLWPNSNQSFYWISSFKWIKLNYPKKYCVKDQYSMWFTNRFSSYLGRLVHAGHTLTLQTYALEKKKSFTNSDHLLFTHYTLIMNLTKTESLTLRPGSQEESGYYSLEWRWLPKGHNKALSLMAAPLTLNGSVKKVSGQWYPLPWHF